MPVVMRARTRLKLGIAFILGSNLLFFTSAWIAWMPWPASVKATLWSILFFTPEVGTPAGSSPTKTSFVPLAARMFQSWLKSWFHPVPQPPPPPTVRSPLNSTTSQAV